MHAVFWVSAMVAAWQADAGACPSTTPCLLCVLRVVCVLCLPCMRAVCRQVMASWT